MLPSVLSVRFILNKTPLDKNGRGIVQARVRLNGQLTTFPTGIKLRPEQWQNGGPTGKSREALGASRLLAEFSTKLHKLGDELMDRQGTLSLSQLKAEFYGKQEQNSVGVIGFYDWFLERKIKLVGAGDNAPGTLERYSVVRKHLGRFINQAKRREDIGWHELDPDMVKDFELYLKVQGKLTHNTSARYMKFFRTVVIAARKKGLLRKDPFEDYSVKLEDKETVYLAVSEIKQLLDKDFHNERLTQVRDVFVFCCYTGLAYVDVEKLKSDHIQTDKEENKWLIVRRQKSKVESTIPLMQPAIEILDTYAPTLELRTGRLLPVNSNQKYNAYLKEIADLCGIEKKLTTHVARHTFGTLMLTYGASLEATAKMLGHSNTKQTQHYAKVLRIKLSMEMETVRDNLRKTGLFA